jgi:hypothetical protein
MTVAAGAAPVLVGGLAGALLLGPVGAQPTDTTASGATASAGATPAPAHCGDGLGDVAEAIGIPTDDLRDGLRDGQTLAAIAEAHGTDPQAVVDVIVADVTERLDAAVIAGRLDQATADERTANLSERADDLVNGELERDVRRHRRGERRHGASALLKAVPLPPLGVAPVAPAGYSSSARSVE